MKMVTEPPRSNRQRSTTPAAGHSRRATAGAKSQPGGPRRNPAVKPVTQRSNTPGAPAQGQSGSPQARVPGTQPANRTPRATSTRRQAAGAEPPARQRQSQPQRAQTPRGKAAGPRVASSAHSPNREPRPQVKGRLALLAATLKPTAFLGWLKTQVGTRRQPNWRGIAAVGLAVVAVVMVLYGGIIQSQTVSKAQQLEGFRARVITAVVVSNGITGTKIDVNGTEVAVAQMDGPVPVGQPLRVRLNPNNPNYVVDARIEPEDAIATAKRTRLFSLLVALIAGAAAIYLFMFGRGKR